MWIVHRVTTDSRVHSPPKTSWRAIGWLKAEDEEMALLKAKRIFGSSLKLVAVSEDERDWGWL